MVIGRQQKDLIDLIKDEKAKDVFTTCGELEDDSDEVFWKVKITYAEKMDKKDPCEINQYVKETYLFDNQRMCEFLHKYYNTNKQVNFQTSPDAERFYLNQNEIEILGTPCSCNKLCVCRKVDSYDIQLSKRYDITNSGTWIELYSELTKKLPMINWTLSREGIGVDEEGKFKNLDSHIHPVITDDGVDIMETVCVEPNIDEKKWAITIGTEIDFDED